MEWIEINTPEDVDCDCEVLLFDGDSYHIDYVDIDVDTGVVFFANGTSQATHYARLTPPKE